LILSIGMIVKNEEGNLESCLSSLQPLMEAVPSELIIVDTGSTDNTVAIAQKYTDKIYIHPWENDYSKMRNFTLDYACGDWFFFIDADEELLEYDAIVEFLMSGKTRQYNAASVKINSFYKTDDTGQFATAMVARLFRRTETFRFAGVIHEQALFDPPLFMLDAVLIHSGYVVDDPELKKRKLQLYEPILLQALKKNPRDVYLWYQLSKTYATYQDAQAALEPAIKAYAIIKKQKLDPSDYLYVYTNLASICLVSGDLEKAEGIAKEGLKIREWLVDLWFYMAKAQAMRKKREEAIQSYKKYLYYADHYDQYVGEDIKIVSFTLTKQEEAWQDLFIVHREILLEDIQEDEKQESVWNRYIDDGIAYIRQAYGENILDNGSRHLMKSKEDAFFLYMGLARQAESADEAAYVRSLRNALGEYPEMKRGIERLLKKITDKMTPAEPVVSSEMEAYGQIVKTNIRQLIDQGMRKEAGELILEFEQILPNDPEIEQMKTLL